MPRQSAASLAILPVSAVQRPEAPDCLDTDEAALWDRVVNSKPPEWFGKDSLPILTEYVRACVMADRLDVWVKAAIAADDKQETDVCLRRRDRESRRAADFATKMRLTQQSRYAAKTAERANNRVQDAEKPWKAA